MIARDRIEALLRPAGWLLAAASAVFLVVVARRHWDAIAGIAVTPEQWLAIAGLCLLYGTSLLLLALAWRLVLGFAGAEPPSGSHAMRAYTMAQLAKYVPGNVFHLVGRHMMHRSAGMPDKELALAALIEVLLMLAGALAIVAGALVLDMPEALRDWSGTALSGLAVLLLAALAAARRLGRGPIRTMLAAFLACCTFFAIMGAVIAGIVALLGGGLSWNAGAGGVAAWIAGFVTPGAPGGLGVREAALVLLGAGSAPVQVLLLAAALLRLVTFCGDLVCFVLGGLLFRDKSA
jgi:uncharacterized membrane protein YbhN (UPF0104 family)